MTVKKIFVGSDHAGFVAKEEIKKLLLALGYEVVDCGTNSSEVSVCLLYTSDAADDIALV